MIEYLIIYILCAYGISNMIVYSSGPFNLFEKIRNLFDNLPSNLGELLHCMICFPSWVGIILSSIDIFLLKDNSFTPFNLIINNDSLWYLIIILDMFITSGSIWLLHTIQETCESITNKNEHE